jgi:hypothetical protein
LNRGPATVRNQRISPIAMRPGEGLLLDHIAGVRPSYGAWLFMPLSRPLAEVGPLDDGLASRPLYPSAVSLFLRRFGLPLMAAIIFSRIMGAAHRAIEASRTFARLVGSRSASLHFAPVTGSAHRAFAARECALGRVRFIPRSRERWAGAETRAQVLGRKKYTNQDRIDQKCE